MHAHALFGLGFLALTSAGFDGDVNAPVVRSLVVEPRPPAAPAGIFVPIHTPSHFPFVTIVKDDGKGPAGGWQAAKASLPFQKFKVPLTAITWYCPLTIGMPIRHSKRGYISPATAATISANVTNSVASRMASRGDYDLKQGVFCHKFFMEVEAAFPSMYPNLGATVAK